MRNGKKHAPISPRWRVVYGIGDLSGVMFVEARDEVEASLTVKEECRKMTGKTPTVYSVTPDKTQ